MQEIGAHYRLIDGAIKIDVSLSSRFASPDESYSHLNLVLLSSFLWQKTMGTNKHICNRICLSNLIWSNGQIEMQLTFLSRCVDSSTLSQNCLSGFPWL